MNDEKIAGVDVKVSKKLHQVPSPRLADYQVFNLCNISMTMEIIDTKNGDIIWFSEVYSIRGRIKGILNFYQERRRNQIFANLDFTFRCGIILLFHDFS